MATKKEKAFPIKVDRNVYPRPEYRFPDVKIGLIYKDSLADFPKPLEAPEGAPNILLVILGPEHPARSAGRRGLWLAERLRRPGQDADGGASGQQWS